MTHNPCLSQAALLEKVKGGELNKEYLPMSGYAAFKEETTKLILGKSARSITEKRVAVIQSLSGTGALRTGGIFIQRFMAGRTIYLPTPTWGNHNAIFKNAGVPIKQYRYINKQMGLDFDGMIADLKVSPDPMPWLRDAVSQRILPADFILFRVLGCPGRQHHPPPCLCPQPDGGRPDHGAMEDHCRHYAGQEHDSLLR